MAAVTSWPELAEDERYDKNLFSHHDESSATTTASTLTDGGSFSAVTNSPPTYEREESHLQGRLPTPDDGSEEYFDRIGSITTVQDDNEERPSTFAQPEPEKKDEDEDEDEDDVQDREGEEEEGSEKQYPHQNDDINSVVNNKREEHDYSKHGLYLENESSSSSTLEQRPVDAQSTFPGSTATVELPPIVSPSQRKQDNNVNRMQRELTTTGITKSMQRVRDQERERVRVQQERSMQQARVRQAKIESEMKLRMLREKEHQIRVQRRMKKQQIEERKRQLEIEAKVKHHSIVRHCAHHRNLRHKLEENKNRMQTIRQVQNAAMVVQRAIRRFLATRDARQQVAVMREERRIEREIQLEREAEEAAMLEMERTKRLRDQRIHQQTSMNRRTYRPKNAKPWTPSAPIHNCERDHPGVAHSDSKHGSMQSPQQRRRRNRKANNKGPKQTADNADQQTNRTPRVGRGNGKGQRGKSQKEKYFDDSNIPKPQNAKHSRRQAAASSRWNSSQDGKDALDKTFKMAKAKGAKGCKSSSSNRIDASMSAFMRESEQQRTNTLQTTVRTINKSNSSNPEMRQRKPTARSTGSSRDENMQLDKVSTDNSQWRRTPDEKPNQNHPQGKHWSPDHLHLCCTSEIDNEYKPFKARPFKRPIGVEAPEPDLGPLQMPEIGKALGFQYEVTT